MTTWRLWLPRHDRICLRMRPISLLIAFLLAVLPVFGHAADPKPAAKPAARVAANANAPKPIGKWDDWQAATHVEAGQTVCYAFTRVKSAVPAVTGRGDVILTVTQRQAQRDAVAISAGFTYAAAAAILVQAEKAALDFYTAGRSAFARDGKTAVTAFAAAAQVLVRSPNPKGGNVVDTFSLKGFGKAYDAINKACPAK